MPCIKLPISSSISVKVNLNVGVWGIGKKQLKKSAAKTDLKMEREVMEVDLD